MKRTKHGLSHYTLSSFDMGQLVPVCNFEVLPGDSVRMSTSCLIRVSPLMSPVMHPVVVRVHHWFVPYRILWDGWEEFITGGPDGLGPGEAFPTFSSEYIDPGGLGDYLGIPYGAGPGGPTISRLPFRAYNRIWNEFYRDQDLQAEVDDDGNIELLNVDWEKDYFTAARPWTQKGPEVVVPLGTFAPVVARDPAASAAGPSFQSASGFNHGQLRTDNTAGNDVLVTTASPNSALKWLDPNLQADLRNAGAAQIREFRLAFALQRYQEARAQYGSRYSEYLRYLGVTSSDARLQRPEYLGGGRSTISFSEVLKTGEGDTPTDDSPIGEMRGHGISAMRSRSFIRFFEEHGVVLSLCSIRPRSMYQDGLHRQWSRRTKEDFWQKELELIGQQEVFNKEVYAVHADPEGVFGYQDRYAEYRHHPSYVCGEFRNILSDWHLARQFGSAPALNADFVKCVPSKRIHAEQTTHTIWGMFSHSIQARRMVGNRTIGRLF